MGDVDVQLRRGGVASNHLPEEKPDDGRSPALAGRPHPVDGVNGQQKTAEVREDRGDPELLDEIGVDQPHGQTDHQPDRRDADQQGNSQDHPRREQDHGDVAVVHDPVRRPDLEILNQAIEKDDQWQRADQLKLSIVPGLVFHGEPIHSAGNATILPQGTNEQAGGRLNYQGLGISLRHHSDF